MARQDCGTVLGPDDPEPVGHYNGNGRAPFLLIGDHAGLHIPDRLGRLGVALPDMARHIACDIGILGLGRLLADRLDAVFLHQRYSRLVIDCNRDPASPEAIPERSDGTVIPGNIAIDDVARRARIEEIHAPYQDAIAREIARRSRAACGTVLVSLHSFTPIMAGEARPWQLGVLYDEGRAMFATAMLDALRADDDLVVGDNQPYRMDSTDYTVPRHAFAAGLLNVELEIRQNLIGDPAEQARWAERIATALTTALASLPGG